MYLAAADRSASAAFVQITLRPIFPSVFPFLPGCISSLLLRPEYHVGLFAVHINDIEFPPVYYYWGDFLVALSPLVCKHHDTSLLYPIFTTSYQ